MTPTRNLFLRVPMAFAAASIAVGAAQACGPMGGSMGGGATGGGGSEDGSHSGGHDDGHHDGGHDGGHDSGWDNAGADRNRQGADDAARGGDDGGDYFGRRSGGGDGEGGGHDLSGQISALGGAMGAAEGADQPGQQANSDGGDDGGIPTTGGWQGWGAMLMGTDQPASPFVPNVPDDPRWKAQMDKPWWQRLREGVDAAFTSTDGPGPDPLAPTGGWNGWISEFTGGNNLENTLIPPPPPPTYNDPDINPAWKDWNDHNLVYKLFVKEPDYKLNYRPGWTVTASTRG